MKIVNLFGLFQNAYSEPGGGCRMKDTLHALIVALILAIPFVIYFWSMKP